MFLFPKSWGCNAHSKTADTGEGTTLYKEERVYDTVDAECFVFVCLFFPFSDIPTASTSLEDEVHFLKCISVCLNVLVSSDFDLVI